MGPTIAAKVDGDGYFTVNPDNISTPEDLKKVHEHLLNDGWQSTSVSFKPKSDRIEEKSIYGSDVEEDPIYHRVQNSRRVKSFVVKSKQGAVRFALEGNSVTINRYGSSPRNTDSNLPDSQTAYFVGTLLLYAMHSVDEFINRNGLRPVVDEVRERRWAIILTCTILTAYSQLGSC